MNCNLVLASVFAKWEQSSENCREILAQLSNYMNDAIVKALKQPNETLCCMQVVRFVIKLWQNILQNPQASCEVVSLYLNKKIKIIEI